MTLSRITTPSDPEHLAAVIPLVDAGRARAEERVRACDLLQRLAGVRATELPAELGRASARVEGLLSDGPSAIDPGAIDPATAVATARRVLAAATAAVDLITDQALVLGDALSTDLATLPLSALHDIADAVLGLSLAPRAAAGWGDPTAAAAAAAVLAVAAEDLRDAARSHERLYARFTEGVWHVPTPMLRAARRRWRLIARARVRRQLRLTCRSGRVGSLSGSVTDLLEVRATRDRLEAVAPMLSHYLEQLDRGPLSDVDAAMSALEAVRLLQTRLGGLLNSERLQQLLLADAFRSPDVAGPAVQVRNAICAWAADVQAAAGGDAGALNLDDLAGWATKCSDLLPALTEGHQAVADLGAPVPTLRALVEILLLRERVEELTPRPQRSASHHAETAS